MTGTTTTCGRCAETIQAEAIVCRFCGAERTTAGWRAPTTAVASAGRTNGLAIAALVLGILWLYGIGSILAIVLGITAKRQIDASGGAETGRGLAVAGIVLGAVGVVGLLLVVLGGAAFLVAA